MPHPDTSAPHADTLPQPLLAASDLCCERDDRVLFNGLNFSVNGGDLWQVSGPNGAGKTTLLRILAGLYVNFSGQVARRLGPGEVLYLGHKTAVKPLHTPEESLRAFLALQAQTPKGSVAEALSAVGLRGYEDVPVRSLSAGQQRRVALARLVISRHRLWILDEPFTAIDKQGVAELEQRLMAHSQSGGAVVITTHQPLQRVAGVRQLHLGQAEAA